MKNSKIVIQKRHNHILELLKQNRTMDVTVLAERLGVTGATIRRDLKKLEQEGTIVRSFGKVSFVGKINVEEIEPTNIEDEKKMVRRAIARYAAGMVENGDVLFLNSSGTASLVVEYLGDKNVTVLTNNTQIIKRIRPRNTQILLTGGEIYGKKESLVGQLAVETISKVTATKCILGVSGIGGNGQMTSFILPETQVNQLMLQNCNGENIIVAEGGKIGITQNFYFGTISEATHLVTDSTADQELLERYRAAGVSTIII